MEKYFILFLLISCLSVLKVQTNDEENYNENQLGSGNEDEDDAKQEYEIKLSDKIIEILEHYQQEDPIGIPGSTIPDPMSIPPLKHSFSVATMNFKNVLVHGLSKFKIIHMHTDVAKMQVNVALDIDTLLVHGNYTMSTFFTRSAGPFTVKLNDVSVTGLGHLAVERKGHLTLQEIAMDVTFKKIDMNFENLGFMGNVFQGIINSVGNFLFDSIKPFILSQANKNIRGDANKQIKKIDKTFPNSISPFDMAIAEARKTVRDRGYDPMKIEDYNNTLGLMDVHLTHTWVTGLSNFYRNGNITIELLNSSLIRTSFDVGTQRLKGSSHWDVGVIGGVLSRSGTFAFTIEHFKVKASINQSIDTREHPIIDTLDLDLGNIQVRCNGAGTADYIIEFLVNILPNLLRYQIMDALENPLKQRIQTILNTTSIDSIARDKLHILDDMQTNGFQF
ncbi:uncharacterized protein LOC123297519 [Chrysoperla carnea]|uniref:uncharacterized protein LOC123297519 n=1 Tax=Chrysoperla carnea TaxID=189513 RepID=UPI001D073842|nr:uncharacterized protein LOC123297519 [Chrysoperla carnea]